MIVLAVIGCLIVVGAVALGIYRHDNLHYMDHALDATGAAGFAEKQVVLSDGSTVNYVEGPDNGDPILLIHGQAVAWEDYYTVLPELAKDHHVFAIDCYGHGGSSHDASLYSCEANGRAIVEFVEIVVGGPVIISGHSSGGVLAAWVAANAPQDVAGAVLEDPPLFEVTPEEMADPLQFQASPKGLILPFPDSDYDCIGPEGLLVGRSRMAFCPCLFRRPGGCCHRERSPHAATDRNVPDPCWIAAS